MKQGAEQWEDMRLAVRLPESKSQLGLYLWASYELLGLPFPHL